MLHSFQKQKKDTVADNRMADGKCASVRETDRDRDSDKETETESEREREGEREIYVHTGACTDSQIWVWFQARDIIGKMASNCGEESGTPSVFCKPILGKQCSLSKRHFAYRNERDSCENHDHIFSQF